MIIYAEEVNLKLASFIAKKIAKTNIRPIYITVFRFIIAVPLCIYFFSHSSYIYNVAGLIVFILLALFDWIDGELARIYKLPNSTKPLGKLIDHTFDRIIVLVVIGTLLYANVYSHMNQSWILVSILFLTSYFFFTTILNDFDKNFSLDFDYYSKVERDTYKLTKKTTLTDEAFLHLIDVRRNSIIRFCFTISYPLFLGIVTNTLFLTFAFITTMMIVRSIGLLYIEYRVLRAYGNTHEISPVIKVLRSRFDKRFQEN